MAFHSSFNDVTIKTCCGFAPLPYKAISKGKDLDNPEDDIIDEAIKYYRVNVFFKNYEVQGPADRLLIYLTVYITHCLKTIEKEATIEGANKKLLQLALETVPRPTEPKFFMNSIFENPKDVKEAELYQSYLRGLKEEMGKRLANMLYTKEGKNILFKFWIGISKRKFLNLTYEGI